MKFPKKLSKERLSLLSKEDLDIYKYEHSGLCPRPIYENNDEEIQEDDFTPYDIKDEAIKSEEYNQGEKEELQSILDELLLESELDGLFDKELIEELGIDEYNNIKKGIFEYIQNDPDLKSLNEAEGHSGDWFIDCSWIVKLSAGLLTGLLGIVAWLIMKGKDRLAMMKLKQYMNKLVELTDQGVQKRKPWYSFLFSGKKKKNTGEYNRACFRTIQETAERNMACLYSRCIHDLGFISPNTTSFDQLANYSKPQPGSGLDKFYTELSAHVKLNPRK